MRIELKNRRIGSVFTFSYRDIETAIFIETGDPDFHELDMLMAELEPLIDEEVEDGISRAKN